MWHLVVCLFWHWTNHTIGGLVIDCDNVNFYCDVHICSSCVCCVCVCIHARVRVYLMCDWACIDVPPASMWMRQSTVSSRTRWVRRQQSCRRGGCDRPVSLVLVGYSTTVLYVAPSTVKRCVGWCTHMVHITSNLHKSSKFWGIPMWIPVNCHAAGRRTSVICPQTLHEVSMDSSWSVCGLFMKCLRTLLDYWALLHANPGIAYMAIPWKR